VQPENPSARPMRFDILTIFPEFFDGPFRFGVLKRALDAGRVRVELQNLRDYASDRHQTVDDRPFGGGEGMVMKPEPIFRAVESSGMAARNQRDVRRERVILLSAQGRPFTQSIARELAELDRVMLICGRYEGVDERVNDLVADMELTIGDYVLSGGELAAAIVVDAVSRLLPGVLGNQDSARYESFAPDRSADEASGQSGTEGASEERPAPFSTCDSGGLLDYPHYTRPAEFLGQSVPQVLCMGNHGEIRRWRRRQSLMKTLKNRPELLRVAKLTAEDRALLEEIRRELGLAEQAHKPPDSV
jgi:tRNA (guanine37-N1)-methyltransferase